MNRETRNMRNRNESCTEFLFAYFAYFAVNLRYLVGAVELSSPTFYHTPPCRNAEAVFDARRAICWKQSIEFPPGCFIDGQFRFLSAIGRPNQIPFTPGE